MVGPEAGRRPPTQVSPLVDPEAFAMSNAQLRAGALSRALAARGVGVGPQERWPAAAAACRKAVSIAPDSVLGWTNLGLALANTGDKAGARSAWERAAALDPTNETVRRNLTNLR